MATVEFDLERTIDAPIERVFARLVDIDGHNDWISGTGSMLRRTRQTSPGPAAVGTTYVDEARVGTLPGEITELEAPHTVVFHWWDRSKKGTLHSEGWPSYHLQPAGPGTTHVRHHAKLTTYGWQRPLTPIFRIFAVRERTATIEALKASFEREPRPAGD